MVNHFNPMHDLLDETHILTDLTFLWPFFQVVKFCRSRLNEYKNTITRQKDDVMRNKYCWRAVKKDKTWIKKRLTLQWSCCLSSICVWQNDTIRHHTVYYTVYIILILNTSLSSDFDYMEYIMIITLKTLKTNLWILNCSVKYFNGYQILICTTAILIFYM